MGLRLLLQQVLPDGKVNDLSIIPLAARDKARPFSTGSVGYNSAAKVVIPSCVDGSDRQHSVGVNMIEDGSLPPEIAAQRKTAREAKKTSAK